MLKVLLFLLIVQSPTFAGDEKAKKWGKLVNKSGRQRMLSQKMAKEFFMIISGMGKADDLNNTIKDFETAHKDLMGNVPNDEIKGQLVKVDKLWKDYKTLLTSNDKGNVEKVYKLSKKVLKQMHKAVQLYEQSSMAEGVKGKGAVINVAGKQRMLTQKMSKEAFLIKIGHKPEKIKKELNKTIDEFDKSLKALINGNSKMRITAATDPKIKGQLGTVKDLWSKFAPDIKKVKDGKSDDAAFKSIATKNVPLLKEMHKAVGMYE